MADGRLRYDFNEQSEVTKEYHRSYCEKLGMKPVIEGAILFGADASGWHCSNVRELYPGSVQSHTNFALAC